MTAGSRLRRVAIVLSATAMVGMTLVGSAVAGGSVHVDCGAGDDLQAAISAAPDGATLVVSGTCTGHFLIKRDVTIEGTGSAMLDGAGVGRTLVIRRGTVTIRRVVVTGGNALYGGGIATNGDVLLDHVTVTGNVAEHGGGIGNDGALRLEHSSVSGNGNDHTAEWARHGDQGILNSGETTLVDSSVNDNLGGGIRNKSGFLVVDHSTIDGNQIAYPRAAAGLENDATARIVASTISNGWADIEGTAGILNLGTMTIAFSTIAHNEGSDNNSGGGGIENGGMLTITSSTISRNFTDAINGSGIANGHANDGIKAGTVKMSATILAGNGYGDCVGRIISEGYNFVGTLAGPPPCKFEDRLTDIRGGSTSEIDARLKEFGDHGGPTQTMPPRPGSLALDEIPVGAMSADHSIALCPTTGTMDQRGRPRPRPGFPYCDIGSVEVPA